MEADLGQQTVQFSSLVSLVANDSFASLKELVENSKSSKQSDDEKKRNILKYVFNTQQRMLRLFALAKWCRQLPKFHACKHQLFHNLPSPAFSVSL